MTLNYTNMNVRIVSFCKKKKTLVTLKYNFEFQHVFWKKIYESHQNGCFEFSLYSCSTKMLITKIDDASHNNLKVQLFRISFMLCNWQRWLPLFSFTILMHLTTAFSGRYVVVVVVEPARKEIPTCWLVVAARHWNVIIIVASANPDAAGGGGNRINTPSSLLGLRYFQMDKKKQEWKGALWTAAGRW